MKKITKKYVCKDCKAEILTKKGTQIIFCPVCNKSNLKLKEEEVYKTEK